MLTITDAYEFYRKKEHKRHWMKGLWVGFKPPKISTFVWKIAVEKVPSTVNLKRRRMMEGDPVYLAYRNGAFEDVNHIFVNCDIARNLWEWASVALQLNLSRMLVRELLLCAAKQSGDAILQIRKLFILTRIWVLWKYGNRTCV